MTNLDSHWDQPYEKKKYELLYTFTEMFESQYKLNAYSDTIYLQENQ